MSEKFEKNEISEEKIEDTDQQGFEENSDIETDASEMLEDGVQEQYKQLPMWQQAMLVILFLFGMAAVVVVIDFVVEFGIELLKRIF